MPPGTRVVLILVAGLAVGLAGCGTGGSSSAGLAPVPKGSFTNANFSGAYAFALTGTDFLTNGFFSAAGALQADGKGNIVSGTEDINDSGSVLTGLPITGVYSVGADGRGVATLYASVGSIDLDFVLLSGGQHGLVIRFDEVSSASGTLDLQDSTAFSAAALAGQFAFNLAGVNASANVLNTVGSFSADGVSALNGGLQDTNTDGVFKPASAFTGAYTVAGNGRGTATFPNASNVQQNFVFYVVNANHLKVIEMDSAQELSGDAYRQQGTFSNATLSGPFAFTLSGASTLGPYVAGGLFTADGNGNVTGGVEDVNNGGNVKQSLSLTGGYSLASSGRGTLALSNTAGTFNFVFYPTVSGLQIMETDSNPLASGSGFAQPAGTYSTASLQNDYGFNSSGASGLGQVDTEALLSVSGSGRFTGAGDFNVGGSLSQGLAFDGPYTMAANGRGTATLTSTAEGGQSFALYAVSPSQVLFIETDSGQVSEGAMLQQ